MESIRNPDAGHITIAGIDPTHEQGKLRNIIGVQLQTSGLPESIRVDEAMALFCAYHGIPARADLLKRLGLQEKMGAQYRTLSTGQQRRLALAIAIAHTPRVLFLDEPTAGLDVSSRIELHNLMAELQAAGTTIILATHDMAEAEKLSSRVAILLGGRIVASGTPRELTAAGAGLSRISVRSEGQSLQTMGTVFPAVRNKVFKDDYHIFYSADPGTTVNSIISHLQSHGDALIDLRVERPSLEERFLEITGPGGAK
jgi:ABC-2 type transport system ATP-binding protein